MPYKFKLGVLISGRGSNLRCINDACVNNVINDASVVAVVSNKESAAGLQYAIDNRIRTCVTESSAYDSQTHFEQKIHEFLYNAEVDLVCLAGFMKILSPWFISQWKGRLINIHPSILPLFKGLHTHQRALDSGEKNHGCTVHYVNEHLDDGEIIAQSIIDIRNDDTTETLAQRVLIEEHKLYPKAINMVLDTISNSLKV
mgnify:CR=1 FL=1